MKIWHQEALYREAAAIRTACGNQDLEEVRRLCANLVDLTKRIEEDVETGSPMACKHGENGKPVPYCDECMKEGFRRW